VDLGVDTFRDAFLAWKLGTKCLSFVPQFVKIVD